MRKRMKTILALLAVSLVSCFLFTSLSFGQEMPKPGEVIDKNNYKKYAHLFPEEYLAGFENGWDGTGDPISIKVSETKSSPWPKAFLALSEKNRGKFTLDKDGYIAGGYDYSGLPFPGLNKNDKDFATKLMYNYRYRYYCDDREGPWISYVRRKGESVIWYTAQSIEILFVNRLYTNPKPSYKTPVGLEDAQLSQYTYPNSVKNFTSLLYKYQNPMKSDDTYTYLPTLRRVLRGDASQRSTPLQGTIQAYDDLVGFNGKIQEFTYQFVKEQKVLAVEESPMSLSLAKKLQVGNKLPFPSDNWEIRNVYVIEIKPKIHGYPQSKKVVYLDEENLDLYYSIASDRAGKLWKIWSVDNKKHLLPDGDKYSYNTGVVGMDVQFGMGTYYTHEYKLNGTGRMYTDIMPSALLKRGQ